MFIRSARNSSAGKSQRRLQVPSSGSTPSISPTWKRAKWKRASSPASTRPRVRYLGGQLALGLKLTSEYEAKGKLPAEVPFFEASGIQFFADEKNVAAIHGGLNVAAVLKTHLCRIGPGDYFAVLGYISMNAENEKALQTIRHKVRDKKKVATVLGFGPRFLHSTGQAYKGGPNSGVFLQITGDDAKDLPVPGQKYTFGIVKAAQARGDFAVLSERGRRALRVHLGKNLKAGLATLSKAVQKAIA